MNVKQVQRGDRHCRGSIFMVAEKKWLLKRKLNNWQSAQSPSLFPLTSSLLNPLFVTK